MFQVFADNLELKMILINFMITYSFRFLKNNMKRNSLIKLLYKFLILNSLLPTWISKKKGCRIWVTIRKQVHRLTLSRNNSQASDQVKKLSMVKMITCHLRTNTNLTKALRIYYKSNNLKFKKLILANLSMISRCNSNQLNLIISKLLEVSS